MRIINSLVVTAAFCSSTAFSFSMRSQQHSFFSTSSLQLATGDADTSTKRRVVVTGLGVVSGCGIGHEAFFQALLEGQSSIDKVTRFDISAYPCQIGSEVPDHMFDPADYFVNPKNVKSNDRYTHFAVAAARQALKDAGMGDTPETLPNPDRIGVMVGTAFGGMETFERETLKLAAKPDRPRVSVAEV
jgi:3-oxoacyl-[acyl-carrier-protein] synthase II